MRRSVQPNRPNAMTWCFFASLKMLAIRRRDHSPCHRVNVLSAYVLWPVFRCPSMAGFGCPPRPQGQNAYSPYFGTIEVAEDGNRLTFETKNPLYPESEQRWSLNRQR